MALKYFIIYLVTFFVGSFAMFSVVKQLVSGFRVRKPLIYGLVSSTLASFLAFGTLYVAQNLFTVYWILCSLFLLFGIVHMMMMHRKYFLPREEKMKVLIGEFMFAASVLVFSLMVFSALLYFLKDKTFLFYPVLLSGLFFFIPYLVMHSFQAAYEIPDAAYITWRYPVTQPIDPPDDNLNEKLLVIGFEIAKKQTDVQKTYFRARAPEGIALGELYYHFINDYNELQSETPIEFLNAQSAAYEWWFRVKPKWYQPQRILDPNLTILANGIKENTVIICERWIQPLQKQQA